MLQTLVRLMLSWLANVHELLSPWWSRTGLVRWFAASPVLGGPDPSKHWVKTKAGFFGLSFHGRADRTCG